jgi:Berberine and berberine like
VLTAFALAIAGAGQGPVSNPGSYVSDSNYFEKRWQQSYWGTNYPRLSEIKRKYDPNGVFFVHNGVGSEQWSADGFTKL